MSNIEYCKTALSDEEIARHKSMLPPKELSDEEVVAQGYCAAEELHIFGRGKQITAQVRQNEQDDDLGWVPCSECDENSTCADAVRRDGCEFGMRV